MFEFEYDRWMSEHNVSVQHDSGPECVPTIVNPNFPGGNYIMFASATSGDRPNNHNFSLCSIGNMTLVSSFFISFSKNVWYLLYRPESRHCHLAIGHCTIRQRVFDCKYLSCKISFNVLNYVFIFNLYCLINIQQHCHNCSHCDWRHHI